MWSSITKTVGSAIEKVQKAANEIESQLDAAVGREELISVAETSRSSDAEVINQLPQTSVLVESEATSDAVIVPTVNVLDIASPQNEKKERAKKPSKSRKKVSEDKPIVSEIKDISPTQSVLPQSLQVVEEAIISDDVARLQFVITDREKSLNRLSSELSEVNNLCETYRQKVESLENELKIKDEKIKLFNANSNVESDLRRQLSKLQEFILEKDSKLNAFETEGQILAKKQGEMEKLTRKLKNEIKEKSDEILKMKESKEQLVHVIDEQQLKIRSFELETNNSSKSINAIQAVSQATAEKLSKLENEMLTKVDEINSQKRALEISWNECNEFKRLSAELKAERDSLRKQLGEGTNKVLETETSKRDTEQREAVLKATNKQLQDSLQRQMQESTSREDRLRDEINELRKRWQEAIMSRESLSTEMSKATAPLLRQISALQDSLRLKSENFQTIEATLTDRVLSAENLASVAEKKLSDVSDINVSLKHELLSLKGNYDDKLSLLESLNEQLKTLSHEGETLKNDLSAASSKLQAEFNEKVELQKQIQDVEVQFKLELQEKKSSYDQDISKLQSELVKLKEYADNFNRLPNENFLLNNSSTDARSLKGLLYAFICKLTS